MTLSCRFIGWPATNVGIVSRKGIASPSLALTFRTLIPNEPNPFHQLIGSGQLRRAAGAFDVVHLSPAIRDDCSR